MSERGLRDNDVLGGPELRLKWWVVAAMKDRICDRGWSLAEVYGMMELPLAEIEDILRGQVRERSLYELLALLTCLGVSVDMDVFGVRVAIGGITVSYGVGDAD